VINKFNARGNGYNFIHRITVTVKTGRQIYTKKANMKYATAKC